MSCDELSEKYASRLGLPSMSSVTLEDFIQALESVALENRGFFIFKIDGERERNIYTFMLNISTTRNIVIRQDADCIRKGMKFFFSELERLGIH